MSNERLTDSEIDHIESVYCGLYSDNGRIKEVCAQAKIANEQAKSPAVAGVAVADDPPVLKSVRSGDGAKLLARFYDYDYFDKAMAAIYPAPAPAGEHPESCAVYYGQDCTCGMDRSVIPECERPAAPASPNVPAAPNGFSELMKFYSVDTVAALVDAQARHIESIQAKLPPLRDEQPRRAREG